MGLPERHSEIVAQLLQGGGGAETPGAKPNIRTSASNGLAALHYAAASHHAAAVSLLLICGADINLADNRGMTPLMHGAGNGADHCCHVLVERGFWLSPRIDLAVKSKEGRSAADLAVHFGHKRVAGDILEAEARRWQNLLDPAEEPADHSSFHDTRRHRVRALGRAPRCAPQGRSALKEMTQLPGHAGAQGLGRCLTHPYQLGRG